MLVMMTVYRLLLITIFSLSATPKVAITLSGIGRDAGVVAFVGLLFMALTFFPPFHPYKSRKGIWFSFGYFAFFALLLTLIFALDLVSIKTFGQRLNGTKFISLFQGNPRTGSFIGNFPIMPFIIGTTLLIWLWWMVIEWLHTWLGMFSRADEKVVRFFWQGLTVVIYITLIMLSISLTTGLDIKELSIGRSLETALKVNPVLTLLFK